MQRLLLLACILIATPLAMAVEVEDSGQGRNATDNQQAGSHEPTGSLPARAALSIQDSIKRIAEAQEAQVPGGNSAKKEQHEIDDLEAQQDMAFWAKQMFYAAAFSAFVSLVATVLLYKTLKETRLAANTSRESAEKQLRAYIWREVVAESLVECSDGRCAIDSTIRNSGQTPAKQVRAWVKIEVLDTVLRKGFEFDGEPPESFVKDSGFIVNPHSAHTLHAESKEPVSPSEKALLRDGRMSFYLWGEIHYQDGFSKPDRVTEFRVWRRVYTSDGREMQIWCPCDKGNNAT